MASISIEIGQLYKSGFKNAKEIYEELRKKGRTVKFSTVRTYLTAIKGSRSMDSNDSNPDSNSQLHDSNDDFNRYAKKEIQGLEKQTETKPQQEIKTEITEPSVQGSNEGQNDSTNSQEQTENLIKQPVQPTENTQLISATNKFSLEGIQAENQQESAIMSETYTKDFKPPVDPDKKMIPVKLHRIGAFNGEITAAVMASDRISKATGGYVMSDDEIKMINEDTKEVLETRLKLIDSEYGDIINLGLGYATMMFKMIVHKIKNPKAKEYIEKEAKEAEDKIIDGIEKATKEIKSEAGEIIEVEKIDKVKDETLLCQSCNERKIYKHGMCQDCFFKAEILKGQKAFDN